MIYQPRSYGLIRLPTPPRAIATGDNHAPNYDRNRCRGRLDGRQQRRQRSEFVLQQTVLRQFRRQRGWPSRLQLQYVGAVPGKHIWKQVLQRKSVLEAGHDKDGPTALGAMPARHRYRIRTGRERE